MPARSRTASSTIPGYRAKPVSAGVVSASGPTTINLATDTFGTPGRARVQDHRAAAPRPPEPGKRPDVLVAERRLHPEPRLGRPGHVQLRGPRQCEHVPALSRRRGGHAERRRRVAERRALRRSGEHDRRHERAPVRERDRGQPARGRGRSTGSRAARRRSAASTRPASTSPPRRRRRRATSRSARRAISGAFDEVTIAITNPPPPQPAPATAAELAAIEASTGSVGHRAGPGPAGSGRRGGRPVPARQRTVRAGRRRPGTGAQRRPAARPLPPSHSGGPAADVPHPDTALRRRAEDARHDHPAGRRPAGRGRRDATRSAATATHRLRPACAYASAGVSGSRASADSISSSENSGSSRLPAR